MSSVIRGSDGRESGKHPAQIQIVTTEVAARQSQAVTAKVAEEVDNVNVTITPRSLRSMILVMAQWCGEYSTNEENNHFSFYRGVEPAGIGKGTSVANNRGIQPGSICYHANRDSTLESVHLHYLDRPNTLNSVRYALRFVQGTTGTLWSCGTVNASTGGAYERGVCRITAMEILL